MATMKRRDAKATRKVVEKPSNLSYGVLEDKRVRGAWWERMRIMYHPTPRSLRATRADLEDHLENILRINELKRVYFCADQWTEPFHADGIYAHEDITG